MHLTGGRASGRRAAPLLLAALLSASPAAVSTAGDEAGSSGNGIATPLELDAAVRWAVEHNLAVRALDARVEEREGERIHAGRPTPGNPVLSGKAARRDAPDDESTDIGVELAQELWIAGQGGLMEEAARARAESARGQRDFLRTSVAARTRRAFLRGLVAREGVRTARRELELAERVQGYATERLALGEGTRLELNATRIGVGQAEAALARARRGREQARLALMELLSLEPSREIPLEGRLAPAPLDLPPRDRLLRRALERRRDLAAAGSAVQSAREELRLARRQLVPNLTVFGFYEREEGADVAGGGLSLPIPLLHRYGGERKAAAARLSRQRRERRALALAVRRQVLGALSDYRRSREAAEAMSGEVLEAAETNVRLTQEAFRAGKLGAPALTTAQERLSRVRREYLGAQRDLVRAATELERATGGLLVLSQKGGAP